MLWRGLDLGVLALVASASAACLPPLPAPLADETDSDTEAVGDVDSDGTSGEESDGVSDDEDSGSGNEDTGPPGDCGVLDALVVTDNGVIRSAENCNLFVGFDPSVGRGMTELRSRQGSDDNVLFTHPEAEYERFAGVVNFPAHTNWNAEIASMDSIEVMQSGPAVFRIRIPWSQSPSEGSGFEGESIYTVIADGRVHRDEYVHVLSGDGLWLAAYTSLRAQTLPVVRIEGGQTVTQDLQVMLDATYDVPEHLYQGDAVGDYTPYLCAYNEDTGDVVGWAEYDGNNTMWHGPRVTRLQHVLADGASTAVALQADWVRDESVVSQEYFGEVMMHLTASSDDDPCAMAQAHYVAYREPGLVNVVSGGSVEPYTGLEPDGNGHHEGGGFYTVAAVDGDAIVLTIDGGAPSFPTVLLHVAGLSASAVTSVSVGGRTLADDEYILQDAGGDVAVAGGVFVLVGVEVEAGEEISIAH